MRKGSLPERLRELQGKLSELQKWVTDLKDGKNDFLLMAGYQELEIKLYFLSKELEDIVEETKGERKMKVA